MIPYLSVKSSQKIKNVLTLIMKASIKKVEAKASTYVSVIIEKGRKISIKLLNSDNVGINGLITF